MLRALWQDHVALSTRPCCCATTRPPRTVGSSDMETARQGERARESEGARDMESAREREMCVGVCETARQGERKSESEGARDTERARERRVCEACVLERESESERAERGARDAERARERCMCGASRNRQNAVGSSFRAQRKPCPNSKASDRRRLQSSNSRQCVVEVKNVNVPTRTRQSRAPTRTVQKDPDSSLQIRWHPVREIRDRIQPK